MTVPTGRIGRVEQGKVRRSDAVVQSETAIVGVSAGHLERARDARDGLDRLLLQFGALRGRCGVITVVATLTATVGGDATAETDGKGRVLAQRVVEAHGV